MGKEERCELTELLVRECACRRHRPDLNGVKVEVVEDEREYAGVEISQPFILAHGNGNCPFCDDDLLEGTEAGYIDGELVCGECLHRERAKETEKFTKKWHEK